MSDITVVPRRITVLCPTGTDLCVGVGLALLCLYYDDQGGLKKKEREKEVIDKALVTRRLNWILLSLDSSRDETTTMNNKNVGTNEEGNSNKKGPSRATLQAVKSFLMSPPVSSSVSQQ